MTAATTKKAKSLTHACVDAEERGNLLTAIIVYWNILHLGLAVEARRREGLDTPDQLLAHISPLGWARILLTGEYLWPKDVGA